MTRKPEYCELTTNQELAPRTHNLRCIVHALHDVIEKRIKNDTPFVVRISGFGSLGKTTLANALARSFPSASVMQTDGFQLNREERRARNLPNGDDPATIDFVSMQHDIAQLISGNPVENRKYNHKTGLHEIIGQILPSKLIILDGASSLYSQLKFNIPTYGIFLDADDDTKLHIRFKVQVGERGYTQEQAFIAMSGWFDGYKKFIQPTIKNSDTIIKIDKNWQYQCPLITHCVCNNLN